MIAHETPIFITTTGCKCPYLSSAGILALLGLSKPPATPVVLTGDFDQISIETIKSPLIFTRDLERVSINSSEIVSKIKKAFLCPSHCYLPFTSICISEIDIKLFKGSKDWVGTIGLATDYLGQQFFIIQIADPKLPPNEWPWNYFSFSESQKVLVRDEILPMVFKESIDPFAKSTILNAISNFNIDYSGIFK